MMLYISLSLAVCIVLALFTWVIPVSRGRTFREVLIERRELKKLRWDVIYFAERMSMETWRFPEFGDMLDSKGDLSGISIFRDGDIYIKKTRLKCSKSQKRRVKGLYDIISNSRGYYQHTEGQLIDMILNKQERK